MAILSFFPIIQNEKNTRKISIRDPKSFLNAQTNSSDYHNLSWDSRDTNFFILKQKLFLPGVTRHLPWDCILLNQMVQACGAWTTIRVLIGNVANLSCIGRPLCLRCRTVGKHGKCYFPRVIVKVAFLSVQHSSWNKHIKHKCAWFCWSNIFLLSFHTSVEFHNMCQI